MNIKTTQGDASPEEQSDHEPSECEHCGGHVMTGCVSCGESWAHEPAPTADGNLPERDPAKPNTEQGLYRKYDVRRTDGSDAPGGKHHGCDYFVLDATHDPHALTALSAYADAVEATHPELAVDMRHRYGFPQVSGGGEVARFEPFISDYPTGHPEDAEPMMGQTTDGGWVRYSDHITALTPHAHEPAPTADGGAVPSAQQWLDDRQAEATGDWRDGWNACRSYYSGKYPAPAPDVALVDAVQFAVTEFADKAHVARVRGDNSLADYYMRCHDRIKPALTAAQQGATNGQE